MNSVRTLRTLAVLEALSFIALLVAVYFKYAEDSPNGVHVLGPIHGLLFLGYCYSALMVSRERAWTTQVQLVLLVCAVLPFGGLAVDRWLRTEVVT